MKFKLPALKELIVQARRTILRFPLVTIFLCVGALNQLCETIFKQAHFKDISRNIFMCLLPLIPVLFSIRVLYEGGGVGRWTKFVMEGLSIAAAALYLLYLPDGPVNNFYFSQFAVIFACSILCCFICVKDGFRHDNLYWSFYVELFTRFIVTCIYTLIILAGTSAALGAVDSLFKTNLFRNEFRIVIVTLWIFSPIFFLSGVPISSDLRDIGDHHPVWLKNLGVYVMIPLALLYLGILYLYGAMILIQWQLPKGMVSYLVLSFAAFGIVSLLIVFPFQKGNAGWIYKFSRWFYFLLLPLLVLLYLAILTRLFEYGITVPRYYVMVLAIWLTCIVIFMVIKKGGNIIFIPFSLLIFAFLSILGPWSSFNVSFEDQKRRLINMLEANSLIQNGKIARSEGPVSPKLKDDIESILKFLDGYGELQSISYLSDSHERVTPRIIAQEIGFNYSGIYASGKPFYFHCTDPLFAFQPGDYVTYVRLKDSLGGGSTAVKRVQAGDYVVEFFPDTAVLRFTYGEFRSSQLDLGQVAKHFDGSGSQPSRSRYEYVHQDDLFEIHCLFDTLAGQEDQDGVHLSYLDASFFIKRR
ncbi:MAG: DUF4153 domain-containing protein [Acidobacteriota bacterium]